MRSRITLKANEKCPRFDSWGITFWWLLPPGVARLSDAIWAEVVVRIPHQQQFLSVMYA